MSKIGRKPIDLNNVQVEIKGQEVRYSAKGASGIHVLPDSLKATLDNQKLMISCSDRHSENNKLWGLHRALLANKIKGISKGFDRELNIAGLGFKGVLSGNKIVFSLGYSHKIDFPLPKDIVVEIDKTGQIIKLKGADKEQVGLFASKIRSLRPPEPYKATGIKFADETIYRKAGKTKAA